MEPVVFTSAMDLEGVVVRGLGAAITTTQMQRVGISQFFPAFNETLPGTINVILDGYGLHVVSPDVRTPPIQWHPEAPAEVFEFIACHVFFGDKKGPFKALIYRAMMSPRRRDPRHVELVLFERVDVEPGTLARVCLQRKPMPITTLVY